MGARGVVDKASPQIADSPEFVCLLGPKTKGGIFCGGFSSFLQASAPVVFERPF